MHSFALHGHQKAITQVLFNREGDLLFSSAKEPGVCVWLTSTGELLGRYETEKATAGIAVNKESTLLATATSDLFSNLWNVQTGEKLATIEQQSTCRSTAFNHDDSLLLLVTDKRFKQQSKIHFYNLPENLGVEPVKTKFNPVFSLESTDESIMTAMWGPTNRHVYYATDKGRVVQYDVEKQREVSHSQPHDASITNLHFDKMYMTMISASKDQSACLLDSRDCRSIARYVSDYPVNDASISPICDHILLGGGTEAQDVTTTGGSSHFDLKFYHKVFESHLGSLKCHFGTINTVQFNPSGKGFASGSADGIIKVFNAFPSSYYESPGSKPVWKPPVEASDEAEESDDAEANGPEDSLAEGVTA